MHPIMLAAEGAAVVETQLLQWLAGGAGAMALLLIGITQKKLASLTKEAEDSKEERHGLDKRVLVLEGDNRTAQAEIAALKRDALTTTEFKFSMAAQNRTLDEQTRLLERHDKKLDALVEDVVDHDEQIREQQRRRSQATMQATRAPLIPRTDSEPPKLRTDGTVELAPSGHGPGSMRPRLKSQQIK